MFWPHVTLKLAQGCSSPLISDSPPYAMTKAGIFLPGEAPFLGGAQRIVRFLRLFEVFIGFEMFLEVLSWFRGSFPISLTSSTFGRASENGSPVLVKKGASLCRRSTTSCGRPQRIGPSALSMAGTRRSDGFRCQNFRLLFKGRTRRNHPVA